MGDNTGTLHALNNTILNLADTASAFSVSLHLYPGAEAALPTQVIIDGAPLNFTLHGKLSNTQSLLIQNKASFVLNGVTQLTDFILDTGATARLVSNCIASVFINDYYLGY